jgi:hypothetical protein
MPIIGASTMPIPGCAPWPDGDPWIQTFSGVEFHPLSPRSRDICIEDIAHALSHLCRFAGHVRTFYSVAEHSLRVSHEAERVATLGGYNDEDIRLHALEGLLHDATEAYLIDLPSPLKRSNPFKGYRIAEDRMRAALCGAFPDLPLHESPIVRGADRTLLSTEARDLLGPQPRIWTQPVPPPLPNTIHPMEPAVARDVFLDRYRDLVLAGPNAVGTCRQCAGAVRLRPEGGLAPMVRGLWGAQCATCLGYLGAWEDRP